MSGARRAVSAAALLAGASSGCGSCANTPPPAALQDAQAALAADSGQVAPRCTIERFTTLEADGELGEAAATATGFAVGVTRRVAGQRVASIAVANEDLSEVSYVDLGPAYGDDPVPRPYAHDADVVVARYVRGREAGATRELELHRLGGKTAQRLLSIPQPLDESFAFDVALAEGGALLAWDEDGPKGNGKIMVAPLEASLDKLAAPPAPASPDTSDAEAPRLAARPGGYWLVWVARRPEPMADASADAHALEGPGELRSFEWLEAVALDAKGKPSGEVRKLTPTSGHVTLFDLAVSGVDLDVVYRDDAEFAEGAGGRIVKVRVKDGGAEAPVELVKSGAGRGAPDLVASGSAWVSYADASERPMLVPLGKTREAVGSPSEEPPLMGGRLLVGSRRENGGLLAGVKPDRGQIVLRKLACRR
jgi:hypothetical protein